MKINEPIVVKNTSNYGTINENSILFDDEQNFNEYLLDYKIHKIVSIKGENGGLIGLQLFYKNRETNESLKSIDINPIGKGTTDEFTFDHLEMITHLTLWKNDALSGFKIKTNKNREFTFGSESGIKIELDEFTEGKNYIIGFFCNYDKKEGITSMGWYYIAQKEYTFLKFFGFFMLRIRLKKEKYRHEKESFLNKMSYDNQVIFRTCCLPDNQFYVIMKFVFN